MLVKLEVDDRLLDHAQRLTGASGPSAVVHAALEALIERESSRRLARLGGSDPDATEVLRRRGSPE